VKKARFAKGTRYSLLPEIKLQRILLLKLIFVIQLSVEMQLIRILEYEKPCVIIAFSSRYF